MTEGVTTQIKLADDARRLYLALRDLRLRAQGIEYDLKFHPQRGHVGALITQLHDAEETANALFVELFTQK